MKKVVLIMFLLMCYCVSVSAEQKEWFDKKYDFKKVDSIFILFDYQPQYDGVSEYEVWEIFSEEFKENLVDKLGRKVKYANLGYVIEQINKERNIDINSLSESNPDEFNKIVGDYVGEHYDLGLKICVFQYEMGTQYFEGYTIDVPDTETSHVLTPYGNATVYTNKTKQQHISGGNAPVAYCSVGFSAYKIADGKPVWNRIDSRARANRSIVENSKPKDLYERIVSSYISDFKKKLKN